MKQNGWIIYYIQLIHTKSDYGKRNQAKNRALKRAEKNPCWRKATRWGKVVAPGVACWAQWEYTHWTLPKLFARPNKCAKRSAKRKAIGKRRIHWGAYTERHSSWSGEIALRPAERKISEYTPWGPLWQSFLLHLTGCMLADFALNRLECNLPVPAWVSLKGVQSLRFSLGVF